MVINAHINLTTFNPSVVGMCERTTGLKLHVENRTKKKNKNLQCMKGINWHVTFPTIANARLRPRLVLAMMPSTCWKTLTNSSSVPNSWKLGMFGIISAKRFFLPTKEKKLVWMKLVNRFWWKHLGNKSCDHEKCETIDDHFSHFSLAPSHLSFSPLLSAASLCTRFSHGISPLSLSILLSSPFCLSHSLILGMAFVW